MVAARGRLYAGRDTESVLSPSPECIAFRRGIDGTSQELSYGHIESAHAVRAAGRCL
jgi:hypothetical protein